MTEKYYASDTGLRNVSVGGAEGTDIGYVLENTVHLEIIRRGYGVTSRSYYSHEIDFVATKGKDIHYYQVSLSIADGRTFERESRSLDLVLDSYPKTIITADRVMSMPPNGIRAVNAVDWMLGDG
ncbi:MAG: DUF4143 domain-containing protein [Candidatus Methanoplasma sp.]|jgi:predicted AAA+ superfamily ATPase|nr:DUF4143 domain-containing protein [Candidatus Methanoplasma sp.]